jgi:hypothetical protein
MERNINLNDLDVVIYHKGCQDGITAAHIFKYECEKQNNKIKLIASGHEGSEINLEKIKNLNVIMVDLTTNNIDKIYENSQKFYVLDHHKSAIDKYSHLNYCYFDLTKCGTIIAYEYVYHDKYIPYFIKCIEVRDLWKWIPGNNPCEYVDENIKNANEFTTGYFKKSETEDLYQVFKSLMEFSDPIVDENNEIVNEIINIGNDLIKTKQNLVNTHKDKVVIEKIKIKNDTKNITYDIIKYETCQELYKIRSDFGNYCMKNFDIDFIVMYYFNEETSEYNCSLRSMYNKTNLVENNIALGHPCAAGITLNIHPDKHFYNIIK